MKKAPLIFDKAMHEARNYWRERLATLSFDGHIALDHPRPRDGQRQPAALEEALAPEVHALLRRITSGNAFLTWTALLHALACCCSKYSGSSEVTLFTPPTAGGPAGGLLPIGVALDGRASFKDALLAMRDRLSQAYRHQQYPFSRMLLDLPEERRPKHLFMSASLAGFHEEVADGECDMAVRVEVTEGGTTVAVRFDARIYEEATIRHFLRGLGLVLRHGLAAMGTALADLRADHGDAAPEPAAGPEPAGATVHGLIEAQAASRPEAVAVVEGHRSTTYAALDRHATNLSQHLAALGLDARRPIALLLDAGVELIVAMLAVAKIGAAFAPVKLLSTKAPLARVLEALGAECVLCGPRIVADLPPLGDGVMHVISIERGNPDGSLAIVHHRSAAPVARAAQGHAAPGSGGPLDVACVVVHARGEEDVSVSPVSHAALVRLFQWLNARGGIGAGDRCLLSPGLGVSEQLYDTLGMLAAGASVDIAGPDALRDASSLLDRLSAPEITVWDLPTPVAQSLLPGLRARVASGEGPRGPRHLLLGGEKQCPSLAARLMKCFPGAQITGLHAPSAGVWTTFFPFPQQDLGSGRGAIAQAIPGFAHEVRNRAGELAPLHTQGELWVAAPRAGAPVRTGLRVEPIEGGRLRWLRGDDHRFLKYGCYVELTEIEAALCEHEDLLAAEVTTVRTERDPDGAVVAFLLALPGQVSAESARDVLLLRDRVDLIPDSFVLLDELPLTAAGDLDRDALIARFAASHTPRGDALSAETHEIHRQLKAIWIELLELDDVGDEDSFFARGGNSLKATLLLARIKDELSVDLSVQKFFREPSPRAVAQLIAAEARTAAGRQKGAEFKIVPREKYRVQLPDLDG